MDHFYLQALIDEKQIDLVATYTATLPPEIQIQTYAYFLEGKCVEDFTAGRFDFLKPENIINCDSCKTMSSKTMRFQV